MNFEGADVMSLSSLLDQSRIAEDESTLARQTQQPPMTLGSTKVVLGSQQMSLENAEKEKKAVASKNDIWQTDEIPTEDAVLSTVDDRPSPRYEFSFKQEIGTQDSFLGLHGKTAGSMDCSHLVVKIHFPGIIASFITLASTDTQTCYCELSYLCFVMTTVRCLLILLYFPSRASSHFSSRLSLSHVD